MSKHNVHTSQSVWDTAIVRPAIVDAFKKLDPRVMAKNPVMFVVEVGSALVSVLFIRDLVRGARVDVKFTAQLVAWLWFTVLFANFAEAMAEGRGKAQAATLRKMRTTTTARRLRRSGDETNLVPGATEGGDEVPATELRRGDVVYVPAGQLIPADGEIVEGVASVDESAITGESAPVVREAGGDRSAVTGGTRVASDWLKIEVMQDPGGGFVDRMIALVEGSERQKTPNEIALTILLAGLTLIFLAATVTLEPFARFFGGSLGIGVLVALLVCLIPTTIGGLLSAIGIAGMDRLVQHNVLATSGRAVEAAGDIDVLMLDKTGTITYGNRQAAAFFPVRGVEERELAAVASLASLADETPEGKSIVALAAGMGLAPSLPTGALFVPFTARTRMSGIDAGERVVRKGASDAVLNHVRSRDGGAIPADLQAIVDRIANEGGTPLVVADGAQVLGVIYLKDTVKPGMRERFERLRAMGIKTVMITGDNPLTAKSIAAEAGVDDFLAEATPEAKLAYIHRMQEGGRLVAMTGDGTNDAPALARADVGVAMNTGTQAAKEAGNMVDLDSDPTKLIEIVEIGKQLLMTRGALTTFSVANDVAKYFSILPAMFTGLLAFQVTRGEAHSSYFWSLNVMRLNSPQSAILSAVIFNALVIVALIPLALRGVSYRPLGAAALLRRNLLVYGLGGVVVPFVAIKVIDVAVGALHLA